MNKFAALVVLITIVVVASATAWYVFYAPTQNGSNSFSLNTTAPGKIVPVTVVSSPSVALGQGFANASHFPFFVDGIGGREIALNGTLRVTHCGSSAGCGVSAAVFTIAGFRAALSGGSWEPSLCFGVNGSCLPARNFTMNLTQLPMVRHSWVYLAIWSNSTMATYRANITQGEFVDGSATGLIVTLSDSPSTVTLGEATWVSTSVSGGIIEYGGGTASPLFYEYSELPPGCVAWNVTSFSCTPVQAGTYQVGVTVLDPYLQSATTSTSLQVT